MDTMKATIGLIYDWHVHKEEEKNTNFLFTILRIFISVCRRLHVMAAAYAEKVVMSGGD